VSNSPSTPQKARFLRRGISKVYWLKKVADQRHPTRKELSEPNRFDLTEAISEIEGWTLENEAIETPDLGSTFNASIPGNDKAEDSSLTFFEDQHKNDVEQQLSKGAKGWIALLRKGDVPGSRSADLFPVQVATRAATWTTDNEAATFKVTFTITDEPALDTEVPPKEPPHTLPYPPKHPGHGSDNEERDVTVISTTATTVNDRDED
jgi:hypothetical protein